MKTYEIQITFSNGLNQMVLTDEGFKENHDGITFENYADAIAEFKDINAEALENDGFAKGHEVNVYISCSEVDEDGEFIITYPNEKTIIID
mgnify:CR=1 FL=1|tara:strand:- start:115 stop:387 length:273 start_codon:yes stop_codon:yes gene_type:complete